MTEPALGQHTCPNGHPVRPSARFCPACGSSIAHPVDETTMRDPGWRPAGPAWPIADPAWPPPPASAPPAPAAPRAGRPSWIGVALAITILLILAAGGGGAGLYLSKRADATPTQAADRATATPTSAARAPATAPAATRTEPAAPPEPPSTDPAGDPAGTVVGIVDIAAVRSDSRAVDVGRTFNEYFGGINQRDIQRTLAVMDPAGVVNRSDARQVEQFRVNVSTTTDTNVVIHWIRDDSGTGAVLVGLTFTSRQEARYGPNGQTCTNWSLVYVLSAASAGQFLIVRTSGTNAAC